MLNVLTVIYYEEAHRTESRILGAHSSFVGQFRERIMMGGSQSASGASRATRAGEYGPDGLSLKGELRPQLSFSLHTRPWCLVPGIVDPASSPARYGHHNSTGSLIQSVVRAPTGDRLVCHTKTLECAEISGNPIDPRSEPSLGPPVEMRKNDE